MLFRGNIVHFYHICAAQMFEKKSSNLIRNLFIIEINANCSDEVGVRLQSSHDMLVSDRLADVLADIR